SEIAFDFRRVDVDAADDREPRPLRDLLDDGSADRTEPEMHHFDVRHKLLDYMPDHPGGLTREHVVWAYRLLLDRDPESDDVIGPKLAGSRDTRELRHHLMTSSEFQEKNRDYAHTNDRTIVIKELENGVRLKLLDRKSTRLNSSHRTISYA